MNTKLRQLRDGVLAHIKEQPTIVTPMRQGLVSDGFGGWVHSGPYVAQNKARVRLQHESGSVQTNVEGATGLDTNLSMYVLTDYRSPLQENDIFVADGFTWTVGPINEFRRHGGLYKTESPLTKGAVS